MTEQERGDRKKVLFSIEIRYPPTAAIIDRRGQLADDLHGQLKGRLEHWRLEPSCVDIQDDLNSPLKRAHIDHRRAYVSYEDESSWDAFWSDCGIVFKAVYGALNVSTVQLSRIGMRLICIHTLPQTFNFEAMMGRVQKAYLKDSHPFSDSLQDLRLVLVTPARRIQFGPVREGEQWVKDSFSAPDSNVPKSGLAVDIDSFSEDVLVESADDLMTKLKLLGEFTFTSEGELLDSICGQQG